MKEFIDKLIERLEEYEYSHLVEHDSEQCLHCQENDDDGCGFRDCFMCVWDKAISIINELAEESTISKMETVGWIPCSERLPEINQKVLVTYEDRYIGGHNGVCEGIYLHSLKSWDISDYMSDDDFRAIAWMPLPAPYEQKQSEMPSEWKQSIMERFEKVE